MNDYVLNHDFGYGHEPEVIELNKLELRNVTDLRDYVTDLAKISFIAEVKDNVIRFLEDNSKVEIIIKEL